MTLTARDLQIAADYQRHIRLLAEAVRPAFADYDRQLQLLANAARATLATHQHNVRFLTGHVVRAAAASPGAAIPVKQVSATRPARPGLPSAQQLLLRALVLMVGLALLIAYWEEQKANAPAEALVVIAGALKVLYDIDEAIWKNLP